MAIQNRKEKDPRQLELPLIFDTVGEVRRGPDETPEKKHKQYRLSSKFSGVGYLRIGTAGKLAISKNIRKPDT